MPKESYDAEAKKEWRRRWRKFVKQLHKPPSDTKVVCFPGREALEVFEVYDTLNIPRANIIGIERDRDSYDHLKSQRLGIELFHGSDTDFFEHTDGKFDVVNLDYDGTFNDEVSRTLKFIAGKQRLTDFSVLGVAVSTRREQKTTKRMYHNQLVGGRFAEIYTLPEPDFEIEYSKVLAMADVDKDDVLNGMKPFGHSKKTIRDTTITGEITSHLAAGRGGSIEFNPIVLKYPNFSKVKELFEEFSTSNNMEHPEPGHYQALLIGEILKFLKDNGLGSDENARLAIARLALGVWNTPYIPIGMQRYEYESEGGTNMFSDFLLLDQRRNVFLKYSYLADNMFGSIDKNQYALHVHGLEYSRKSWGKIGESFKLAVNLTSPVEIPPRVSLGSSYKPKLTGPEYYQLRVVDGKSDEEIKQMRRTTKREMSAFKAHVTMGTYGPVPEKPVEEEHSTAVAEKTEIPKRREFSLHEITNRDARKMISDNATLRIKYFLGDLFGVTSEENAERLVTNIRDSRWYDKIETENPSDTQIYSFFDDLMLCARNGYVPMADEVKGIYRSVLSGGMHERIRGLVTTQHVTEKQKLTSETYSGLIDQGKTEAEILSMHPDATKRQIAAYKAWNTIRSQYHTKPAQKADLNGDTGPTVIGLLESGVSKEDVMERLQLTDYQIRGIKAAHKRGAYKDRLQKPEATSGLPTPRPRNIQYFVDSRGVTHPTQKAWLEAERGYRG